MVVGQLTLVILLQAVVAVHQIYVSTQILSLLA
jgi:hypothetical protein